MAQLVYQAVLTNSSGTIVGCALYSTQLLAERAVSIIRRENPSLTAHILPLPVFDKVNREAGKELEVSK